MFEFFQFIFRIAYFYKSILQQRLAFTLKNILKQN